MGRGTAAPGSTVLGAAFWGTKNSPCIVLLSSRISIKITENACGMERGGKVDFAPGARNVRAATEFVCRILLRCTRHNQSPENSYTCMVVNVNLICDR